MSDEPTRPTLPLDPDDAPTERSPLPDALAPTEDIDTALLPGGSDHPAPSDAATDFVGATRPMTEASVGTTRPMTHKRLALAGSSSRSDLLEEACRRLRIAVGAALVGLTLAVLALPFVQANVGGIRDGLARPFWTIPVGIVASVAMFAVAGRRSMAPSRRLDFGLVYLVFVCGLVSAFSHWLPYDDQLDVVRGPSGAALAVLVFSAIVPVHPGRLAVAAFAAALTDPLALIATFGLGNPVPRVTFWLWLFLPTFASAAIAVAASRTLYDLSERLDQARQMGSYRLQRLLGAGGMGEVWQAAHSTLARPAAIKLIRADRLGDDPEEAERVRRRFEREAQATAMLQSPHTIEVYDFGVSDDGSFYYVMELLDGMDLGRLVDESGPLPAERVVHLLLQACLSLEEAHGRGMVHRDIKPANLYVCRRAQQLDFIKVLDFGIVKLPDDAGETQLTAENSISGTPAFLPPEMARGEHLDGRADIYALGCVAFFLLTGRLVFEVAGALPMLMAHVERAPRAPSTLLDVPPALDALVLSCLAKNPAQRPESCAALREQLLATGLADGWDQDKAAGWWKDR
jgi:eukaryotic-like serine/threonine-protein kinase